MTAELITREAVGQVLLRADEGDGRTLEIRLVPWDTIAQTEQGPECFTRGAFEGTDPELVTVEAMRHGGELVGRGLVLTDDDDGPRLTARVSQTRAGDELLTLLRDGVIRQASIAFAEVKRGSRKRPDGVIERRRVDLRRVAILERGAYPGAGVLAVRREPDMAETEQEQQPQAPPAPVVDLVPVTDRLERIESRMGAIETLGHTGSGRARVPRGVDGRAPVRRVEPARARAGALGSAVERVPGPDPQGRACRGAGHHQPGPAHHRCVRCPGTAAVKGMTVSWPKLGTAMTGLIAAQSAEKAAVVSAKVSFTEGTSAIVTYAGASDVSYQLIRRSDPPYLEQYARVMLTAWANVTNAAFSAAVYAGSAAASAWAATTDTDGSKFIAALVDASVKCELATGVPAEFVILAPDLFSKVAVFYAPKSINPQSVAGTALASTLAISVSGVTVINESALAASTGYVSNSLAAAWLEDPLGAPAQISVDDAEKIGQNIAYWSLGSAPLFAPLGIVKFTIT